MSRMYRVMVEESIRRVVKGSDKVTTKVDLLPVLERGDMGNLLGDELVNDGFTREGNTCKKTENGITVTVDLEKQEVEISVEEEHEVEKSGKMETRADADFQKESTAKENLQKKLCAALEDEVQQDRDELQKEVTKKLESSIQEKLKKINDAATRATGKALKVKAAQIGDVQEVHEGENGELTIKIRV